MLATARVLTAYTCYCAFIDDICLLLRVQRPGIYSEEYLNRIDQVVQWAKEQDVRVLIDFHQDWYSYSLNNGSRIGGYVDGAPAWAVLNESITMPPLEIAVWDKIGFDWRTVAGRNPS